MASVGAWATCVWGVADGASVSFFADATEAIESATADSREAIAGFAGSIAVDADCVGSGAAAATGAGADVGAGAGVEATVVDRDSGCQLSGFVH